MPCFPVLAAVVDDFEKKGLMRLVDSNRGVEEVSVRAFGLLCCEWCGAVQHITMVPVAVAIVL